MGVFPREWWEEQMDLTVLTVEQRAALREHEMRWRDIGMLLSEVHRRERAFIDAAHGGGTHPDRAFGGG